MQKPIKQHKPTLMLPETAKALADVQGFVNFFMFTRTGNPAYMQRGTALSQQDMIIMQGFANWLLELSTEEDNGPAL